MAWVHSVQLSNFFQIARGDANARAQIQIKGTREIINLFFGKEEYFYIPSLG